MDEDADDGPTEEAFDKWFTPSLALALLHHISPQQGVNALLTRLKAKRLKAYARTATWVTNGEDREAHLTEFPPEWWDKVAARQSYQDFWAGAVGDLTVQDRGRNIPIYFLDVRFDPDGLFPLLPPIAHAVSVIALAEDERLTARRSSSLAARLEEPKPLPPKIERLILREWVRTFCASHPGAPFRIIRDGARGAFPQFRVSERQVKHEIAELELTLSPGNPRIMQK